MEISIRTIDNSENNGIIYVMKTETITNIIKNVIARSDDKSLITGLRTSRTDSMEFVYRNTDDYIGNDDIEFLTDVVRSTAILLFRGLTTEKYTNIGTIMGLCECDHNMASNSIKRDMSTMDKHYDYDIVKNIVNKYMRMIVSNEIETNPYFFFGNIYNLMNPKFHNDKMRDIVKEYVKITR